MVRQPIVKLYILAIVIVGFNLLQAKPVRGEDGIYSDSPDTLGQPTVEQDIPAYASDKLSEQYRGSTKLRTQRGTEARNPTEQKRHPIVSGPQGSSLRTFSMIVKPRGISLAQTMASIYLANPKAFINGDPDKLNPTVPLKIPPLSAMHSVSEADAQKILGNIGGSGRVSTAQDKTNATLPSPEVSKPAPAKMQQPTAEPRERAVAQAQLETLQNSVAEKDASLKNAKERIEKLETELKALQQHARPIPPAPQLPKAAAVSGPDLRWVVLITLAAAIIACIVLLVFLLKRKKVANTKVNSSSRPTKVAKPVFITDPDEISAIADLALNKDESGAPQPEAPLVAHDTELEFFDGSLGLDPPMDQGLGTAKPAALNVSKAESGNAAPSPAPVPSPATPSYPTLDIVEPAVETRNEQPFELDVDLKPTDLPEPEPVLKELRSEDEELLLNFDFEPEKNSSAPAADLSSTVAAEGYVAAQEDTEPPELDDLGSAEATRLDLVRVYLDMGDKEGAREILHDILHHAQGKLKNEADALLATIE